PCTRSTLVPLPTLRSPHTSPPFPYTTLFRSPTSEIAARLGVTEQWIESRTGVRERRVAGREDRLADLAAAAGRDALDRAGVGAEAIDLVIVATCTADAPVPATAPVVAGLLGAARAGAFDVNAGCTGFLAALEIAYAARVP